MNKEAVIAQILQDRSSEPGSFGSAFAPANIALCKYWGKRDFELNLPVTSSLSVSLGEKGAQTQISLADKDRVTLNGAELALSDPFSVRILRFLDYFRPAPDAGFLFETVSTIPVAAGLASSASGFASAVIALDDLFGWGLLAKELSILARLGSGSASRSIYSGFVEWHAGAAQDGMDSFAEPIGEAWPEFRLGLLTLDAGRKSIGSREAMNRTVDTSVLYQAWPGQIADDLLDIRRSIQDRDFERLGRATERNALSMHATMIAAWPPVIYWSPETIQAIRRIHQARAEGVPVYLTMDAGPNVKVLFLASSESDICGCIEGLEVLSPFS